MSKMNTLKKLYGLKKGDRVKFAEEKQSYKVVIAAGDFAICIKPFNRIL